MKRFMSSGRPSSLVLIDEFGGGTEPQIGGGYSTGYTWPVCRDRGVGVITTHYQNPKQFAKETDGLVNGSIVYDRQRMEPLFRLSIGTPEVRLLLRLPERSVCLTT